VFEEPEEDFAAMFEASIKAKRVDRGQTVEGRIVAIGPEFAFVDVGGKGEAQIDVAELKDGDGALEVAVGDRITAVVVSTEGGLTLSRRLAGGSASDKQLEDAFDAGLAVEGRVEGVNKGGFEVRIGRHRAFCPMSQIDIRRVADPAEHVGHTYTFRITEYKDGGRNLVVSRRRLLEEEQAVLAEDVRRTVVPGAVVTGRVASIVEFGAFVELGGGVQGLLHVSEMGWSRVTDIRAVVTEGQEITVKVLRVDDANGRIALGLKQLADDPWTTVQDRYEVGQVVSGRVTRLAQFGAFVEIEPGIEGLAHASTFAPSGHSSGWTRTVPVGMVAAFEVMTVELDKKRIGLALVPEGSSRAAGVPSSGGAIAPGARLTGKVERHETFGVFVFLAPGRTGLIPLSETGVARGADVRAAFPVGSDVEVIVLEVDAEGRRIRLSRKAVGEAAEAEVVREYAAREDAQPDRSMGSLGDKLRGALDPKNR
jgi:small subunit ribosomal protein S1